MQLLPTTTGNFSGFVNISSETVLEKLSPLNKLRNYGDRWGKLGPVRKHQSHPAGQSEVGNWNTSGTGLVRVIASSRSYSKLFTTDILSTQLTAPGSPRMTHYGNAIIPAWAGSSHHDNEYVKYDQYSSSSCLFHSIAP